MIPKSGCRCSEKRSCSTKRSSDGSDSAKLDQTLVSATQLDPIRSRAVCDEVDCGAHRRLCACIEPEPDAALSSAAVQQFLRGRLANFKVPKDIQFLDALPREASGKIFKRKLRDPYWEGRIRSGA